MSQHRISFDTGEKAATEAHDCGTFHLLVPEDQVMSHMEALTMLGFTPRHSVDAEA